MAKSNQEEQLQQHNTKPNKPKKISKLVKKQLLELIFEKGRKIKSAAEELKINYSSAKTILHLYRKKQRRVNNIIHSNIPCYYEKIEPGMETNRIVVKSTLGFKYLSEKDIKYEYNKNMD